MCLEGGMAAARSASMIGGIGVRGSPGAISMSPCCMPGMASIDMPAMSCPMPAWSIGGAISAGGSGIAWSILE